MRIGIVGLIHLVVGIVIASNERYLRDVDTVREIISAVLAIVLWPLVLLGVDLHIRG